MTTRNVIISLLEPTPQVRTLYFRPRLSSVDGDVLVGSRHAVTTNASGDATVALPCRSDGRNIRWDVEIPRSNGMSAEYFLLGLDDGSDISLDDLLAAGGLADSNVIQYISKYVDAALDDLDLNALTDVIIGSTSDGQTLRYDETTQTWKNQSLTKSDVGLPNVNNTSDAAKPVSTAQAAAILAASSSTDLAAYFDEDARSHINHGYFWERDIQHGPCFWEVWFNANAGAEYFISDGYGGSHNVLFGVTGMDDGYGQLSGNMFHDASSGVGYPANDSFYAGDWHLASMGYDGTYIRTYLDGVFQGKIALGGVRQSSGSVADGMLYVGGSGHSRWNGMIRMIRGFEGICPVVTETSYQPELNFKNAFNDPTGNGVYGCQFLADYTVPASIIADLSDGYDGVRHPGRPGTWDEEVGTFGAIASSYANANVQIFQAAGFGPPSTYRGTTTATPVGAVLFDAFERVDTSPVWQTAANITLGVAPTGQTWQGTGIGVIDSHAYSAVSNSTIQYANVGKANQDVRLTRKGVNDYPYVIARYTDAANYLRADSDGSNIHVWEVIGGAFTLKVNVATVAYNTLRLKATGSTVEVYVDDETSPRGSFTTTIMTGNNAAFYIDVNQLPGMRAKQIVVY